MRNLLEPHRKGKSMSWLAPVVLKGSLVSLVPLSHEHCSELTEAVKDGEIWKLWFTTVPHPETMYNEITRRLELLKKESMLPFTVIENTSGKPVGMTSFMNIDSINRRPEIGSTWYRKSVQKTGLNIEAKKLLLTHAFEDKNAIAVELRTHFFNRNSRRSIERIGAKLDGILRNHNFATNGTLRDTCVYSIIASEWMTVKAHLEFLLDSARRI